MSESQAPCDQGYEDGLAERGTVESQLCKTRIEQVFCKPHAHNA